MRLGDRIQMRCDELGISVRQLALKAGLSTSYVYGLVRGEKGLGVDSAQKLAEALDWSVSELLGEAAPSGPDRWFWTSRLSALNSEQLRELMRGRPAERVAWVLNELAAYYPELPVAEMAGTSPDHIERLREGTGAISGQLVDALTRSLNLPEHWLTLGEVGPTESLIYAVLQHHRAREWLELILEAIDLNVPPVAVRRLIRTVHDVVRETSE